MIELVILAFIGVIFIGIVAVAVYFFNSFVVKRNRVRTAWAQIDVQLKKRYDLIPNLVETVKGYAKHEKSVFENVSKARSAMMSAKGPADLARADNMMTAALKSLFAVAEAYPELKANQNFLNLQNQLKEIEDKIAYARQFYNDSVYDFNNSIQMFPGNIFATVFGFKQSEFFKAEGEEAKAVKVKF